MRSPSLSKAVDRLIALLAWEKEHHGYKSPDIPMAILLYLATHRAKHTSHKQLYQSLPSSSPTSIRWLKRLIKDGMVSIEPAANDKRTSVLTLTARGESFLIDYAVAVNCAGDGDSKSSRRSTTIQ